jgi:tetratricopeptide (TPR) repeat protein
MSWTDGVDWQQLNRDLQNVEMLRLQQEQNELMKAAARKPAPRPRAETRPVEIEEHDEADCEGVMIGKRSAHLTQLMESPYRTGHDVMLWAELWAEQYSFTPESDVERRQSIYQKIFSSYFVAATEYANNDAMFRLSQMLEQTGEHDAALKYLELAAECGNVAAMNSFIWDQLIPKKNWDAIRGFVERAKNQDTLGQTTNAISNGSIALYLEGKVDEAIAGFTEALEREDKFAEPEANWWLAKIYLERGEDKLAKAHSKLSEAAGGYEPPDWA